MKYFLILSTLLISFVSSYASDEYNIKLNFIEFYLPAYLTSEVDDVYLSSNYKMSYMFDGDVSTSFGIVNGVDSISFSIEFDTPISIDEIRMFSGNFQSKENFYNSYRFVRCGLSVFKRNEYGEVEYSFYTNIEFPNKPLPLILTNFENSGNIFNGISFYFDSLNYEGNVKISDVYISDIQIWYKGKQYKIINLSRLEEKLNYSFLLPARYWQKKYQLERHFKYRERPLKQWWEFWKSDKEYKKAQPPLFLTKSVNFFKDFGFYIREAFIWLILSISCLVFAIVKRKSNMPAWVRVMNIISPAIILALAFLKFVFPMEIDVLIKGIFVLLLLLSCAILSISLIIIVILRWKKLVIIEKIGYLSYAVILSLSYFFIFGLLILP